MMQALAMDSPVLAEMAVVRHNVGGLSFRQNPVRFVSLPKPQIQLLKKLNVRAFDSGTVTPEKLSPVIQLTEKATVRLRKLRGENKSRYLRIGVRQGGCSGISRIGRRQECHLFQAALRDEVEAAVFAPSLGPDLFLLDLASKLEDSIGHEGSEHDPLAKLREEATEAMLSSHWPTNKDEAYRFTDLRFLKQANINPVMASPENLSFNISSLNLPEVNRLTFVDGMFSSVLSRLEGLPDGLVVASISKLSQDIVKEHVLPNLSGISARSQGDVFACLNGVGARDLGVIIVPAGLKVSDTLQILYISTKGDQVKEERSTFSLSNPRLLIVVDKDGELDIVEDFVGEPDSVYWTNSVCEIFIAEGGRLGHNYVQEQTRDSVHMRQTYVSQAEASSYKMVEGCFGARLSRHNLHIQQLGPDTITELATFMLAGRKQLQDLHSKLVLNHPRGFSRQLHKCIVTDSSAHVVFDGNVRVNRYAQQTDAGQLTRSLLLAPRATVNVKPNLQIIANDVKCSHGAAISDLEEEQLFYFRARGIDTQTARGALVFSFGAEVLQKLDSEELRKRAEIVVKDSLASEGVIRPDLPVSV